MKSSEFTDNKLYCYLEPTESPVLALNDQPKIREPGLPIRPAVSCSGSLFYNLKKHIANTSCYDLGSKMSWHGDFKFY